MAVDEALLRSAEERGRPLLRVYSWLRPAVSIGYFQKFPAHLADRYEIVRRPTGGGLVYHGDGVDTTYTVVVPPTHALYRMKTADAYCAIHKAVAAALKNCRCESHSRPSYSPPQKHFAATIPGLHQTQIASPHGSYECFQNPVHGDVVADGKKLAGAAQRRTKRGLLHQGSIAANVSAEDLAGGVREALGAEFEPRSLQCKEAELVRQLVGEKYGTAQWNRR